MAYRPDDSQAPFAQGAIENPLVDCRRSARARAAYSPTPSQLLGQGARPDRCPAKSAHVSSVHDPTLAAQDAEVGDLAGRVFAAFEIGAFAVEVLDHAAQFGFVEERKERQGDCA